MWNTVETHIRECVVIIVILSVQFQAHKKRGPLALCSAFLRFLPEWWYRFGGRRSSGL